MISTHRLAHCDLPLPSPFPSPSLAELQGV